MHIEIDNEKYVELDDVLKMTGIKQTTLYIKMKYEGFPKPENKVVPTPRKRALWRLSEIEAYIEGTRK